MAAELGADHSVLRFSSGDTEGDLYNQRSGVVEHEPAEDHQDARIVSERGSSAEAAVAGAAESLQEMEFRAELAGSAEPVSDTVAGTDAEHRKELNRQQERKRLNRSRLTSRNEGPRTHRTRPCAFGWIAKECSPARVRSRRAKSGR